MHRNYAMFFLQFKNLVQNYKLLFVVFERSNSIFHNEIIAFSSLLIKNVVENNYLHSYFTWGSRFISQLNTYCSVLMLYGGWLDMSIRVCVSLCTMLNWHDQFNLFSIWRINLCILFYIANYHNIIILYDTKI